MAPPFKTHCKWGHEYTESNTKWTALASGYRVRKCKECRRQADRERYEDKPAYRERAKERALNWYHKNKDAVDSVRETTYNTAS